MQNVRKFSGDVLVLATHNKGKLAEITAMMQGIVPDVRIAGDLDLESPEETGMTFFENAAIKAVFVARETGFPALADDSGLCVSALDGDPGVYSADWAGEPRDFNRAMKMVHERMGDNPDKSARFTTCCVLAWPDGHTEYSEGHVEGEMIWPPRGAKGFGYDPVFIPEGRDVTFAEMAAEDKNAISHRSRALKAILDKCFR